MKTSHMWRNCYIRELNIPSPWKSEDAFSCDPVRQDIFYVECSRSEVEEHVTLFIRDDQHKRKVEESIRASQSKSFLFIVSRSLQYVQYYPWLSVSSPNSLWDNIGETMIISLGQLKEYRTNKESDK